MSQYAGIIRNDIVDCDAGICVSFWVQGCPFKCKGCHNPQTWSLDGGLPLEPTYIETVISCLEANGLQRSLSILGGEPLFGRNRDIVLNLIKAVKRNLPSTKIYLWTGYTYEALTKERNPKILEILDNLDVLVDGLFDETKKETGLKLRGSANQNLYRSVGGILTKELLTN